MFVFSNQITRMPVVVFYRQHLFPQLSQLLPEQRNTSMCRVLSELSVMVHVYILFFKNKFKFYILSTVNIFVYFL